jgi:uncharacterized repeat protein (TIGR03803 family)
VARAFPIFTSNARNGFVGTRLASTIVAALLSTVGPLPAHAHSFEVLYAFKGGVDGSGPNGGLAQDATGNLYGATSSGGGSANCNGGCGTVYKVDSHGNETVLYGFSGEADGQYPSPLILDSSGNIYGTTLWGGDPDCQGYGSCGVVYELSASGTETVLHTFEGSGDGTNPEAPVIMDSAGNLYGTTLAGGAGGGCVGNNPPGCGTVFEVSSSGQETILHAFAGQDGANPSAGLLRDSSGNLYGSTLEGGTYGYGTIFKLDSGGKLTILHEFTGSAPDNGYPYDGLVSDKAGDLYGTTEWHPAGSDVFGTAFELEPRSRTLTTLFSFDLCDGGYTEAGLLRDSSGTLYGTTLSGGRDRGGRCVGGGTVFKLDKNGKESTMEVFGTKNKGDAPRSILVQDKAGNLYGTALDGPGGNGVVFEIAP